jgi:hypothetical protein
MKHIHGILGLCLVNALITGCAATLPVQEVRHVSAAYDAAAAAGGPLLDDLAIAERRAELRAPPDGVSAFTAGDVTVFMTFKPAVAASLASIGDPARTAQQRRGLKVVGAYVDVLEVLAEGRNIEEAKARIHTLGANIAGLAALATGGTSLLTQPLQAAFGPILDAAARARNAEELRELALRGEKPIDDLLVRLIESSEPIYAVLIDEPRRAATITLTQNKPAQRAELMKIAAYQVAVGNYVVLLEQMRVTLSTLADVVRSRSRSTLAALSTNTNELLVQAHAIRRAYAVLRNPAGAGSVMEVTQ